ncbi:MAG: hypothetical protein B6247_24490 [Candidatus Parabeggiatoa sp. nov. 2]|nr:MAG: hypothetical protein B6247_24490 [Beggiatoa sp. 4572_84]
MESKPSGLDTITGIEQRDFIFSSIFSSPTEWRVNRHKNLQLKTFKMESKPSGLDFIKTYALIQLTN